MTSPHFAWLPPEINSALMFAGPGAGPLLAAAAAWDGLAEDLATSATAFGSVTSELAGNAWLGPSSAAMMAVATQYVGLLSTSAAQAEQAAGQARATASAFEMALAATVQPAVVEANRALQQVLAATNWLGQNAPAIADIEAAYEQMWALDVAAMSAYHADASEAATQLAPWRQVLQNLGISFNSNGQISLGFGNTGASNLGAGNTGIGNVGSGNTGTGNVGTGNVGTSNLGTGNTGIGNIGFGNTGSGDIGFGLTGDHQIGFGGFNAGSGNIGFGNTGTGNIGFFNSGTGNIGIGNTGTSNTGFFNSGNVNTGFANTGAMNTGFCNTGLEQTGFVGQTTPDPGLLGSSRVVSGAMGAANTSSGLLNTFADVGGANQGLRYASLLGDSAVPAAAMGGATGIATGGFDAGPGSPGIGAASATGGTLVGSASRTAAAGYTSFFNSANNDSSSRVGALREPGLREPASTGSGIPKSNFYASRESDESVTSLQPPIRTE